MTTLGRFYLANSAVCQEVAIEASSSGLQLSEPHTGTEICHLTSAMFQVEHMPFSPEIDLVLASGEKLVMPREFDLSSVMLPDGVESSMHESSRKSAWYLLCLGLLPLWVVVFFKVIIPMAIFFLGHWLPSSWIAQAAEQNRQTYLRSAPVSEPALFRHHQYFFLTWKRMLERAELAPEDYPISLHVTNPQAQAFYAFADGHLAVDDAMLDLIADEPDLLPILAAHELGHQRAQHKLAMVEALVKRKLLPSATPTGPFEGMIDWLAAPSNRSSPFDSSPYGYLAERQAREFADWMLIRMKFDQPMINKALSRLNRVSPLPAPLENYLVRHPQLKRHLDRLASRRIRWIE